VVRIANDNKQPTEPRKDKQDNDEPLPEKEKRNEEDCSELKEQMLRLAAEFDNYKKRVKRDVDSAESNGKILLIKKMLPIIDEFELAMLAVNGTKDTTVSKGIEMLYSNFVEVLKKEGLSEVDCVGVFDPYKHEIIMVKDSEEKEGTILEVVKKGYIFDDKLIRPASVIIAKERETKEENKKE
jgi:molecular chaperone GrpE